MNAKKNKNVQQYGWGVNWNKLLSTGNTFCRGSIFKSMLYCQDPDTVRKVEARRKGSNCIRQPNIKALNFQGAPRWREMCKWIIPAWADPRWMCWGEGAFAAVFTTKTNSASTNIQFWENRPTRSREALQGRVTTSQTNGWEMSLWKFQDVSPPTG